MSENTGPKQATSETILDLDKMLGLSHTIKVKWQGHTFELQHISNLSPEALSQFLHLQAALEKERLDTDPDSLPRMSATVDEILKLVCPRLLDAGLTFLQKVSVFTFYAAEVNKDSGLGGAVPISKKGRGRLTGGRSSRPSASGTT